MLVIGLTGSIGMGKSATAEMFRAEGVPVHDSDAAVHELYRGSAVPLIRAEFPQAIVDGVVDRAVLASLVLGNAAALKKLEGVIHPLVGASRLAFVDRHTRAGATVAIVDIPLLFETGGEKIVDLIVTCSAPADIQEQRVLARPNMTREKFMAIRGKQIADEIKRRRSHFIIETGYGFDHARRQVQNLLRSISRV